MTVTTAQAHVAANIWGRFMRSCNANVMRYMYDGEGNERPAARKMADLGAVLFMVRCKSSHYRTAHKSLK